MKKYFSLTLIISLFLSFSHAQHTSDIDTARLDEVIISYQANRLTPVTFQNISSTEIQAKSIGQEPSFLLAETPSITNYADAGSGQGYSYIRLRGIDQTRINMTLDGVPINEPEDQGAYFSNYADILNSVSRMQIQRGVGTSKNGVASFGGSIELFSPNLRDTSQGRIGLGYGSFNSLRAFGTYHSGLKNGKALYARASQIYSDGYTYNAFNNSQSIFLSGGLFFDKSYLKLNFLTGQQRNGMAWLGVSDSLIQIDSRTNANSEQEQDRFLQSLAQIQHNWQISPSSSLQSSLYYTFLRGNYDFDLNNFLGFPSTEELFNYDFRSGFTGFYSNYTLSRQRLNWTSGLHGNIYNRRHIGSEKTLGELYQNTGFKQEASVFSKVNYSLNRFSLFADIQYRYVNFDYEGTVSLESLNWQFLNPKAGILLSINEQATLYYSIGSTGREPTRNDMFGGNDELLADSLGNAILFNTEAESVVDQELGFRYRNQNLQVDVNLFYMDFNNEIVLNGNFGPNGLALTNNVEQSIRAGLELHLSYRANKHFTFVNNSSFNYSRIREQEEVFSPILTPPLIINQEVIYTHNKLALALTGRYQHRSFIDFANTAMVNSYVLLNARASYALNRVRLSFFMNNITNASYFNNGYIDFDGSRKLFVQAPTNFFLALQYHF